MNISFEYDWMPVETAKGARYHFPEKLTSHLRESCSGPAIYRWVVYSEQPGDLRRLYVGEAEALPRRIYQYLNPGPSQWTNLRLKAKFEEELGLKNRVTLEVLSFNPFSIEGIRISKTDLADKAVRRFLEELLVIYYSRTGYTVLNLQ